MIKFSISIILFILLPFGYLFAQNKPNPALLKVWTISEFIENGKKYGEKEMVEVIVDLRGDGTYVYWEENDSEDGLWEMTEDGSKIIFDKGTAREFVWDVVSFEPNRLEVKFTVEKSRYHFTFTEKVKKAEDN